MTTHEDERPAPVGTRRAIKAVGTGLSLVSIGFFGWAAKDHVHALASMHLGANAALGIAGGLMAHLLLIVVDGLGWSFLLRGVGQRAPVLETLGIFCVTQFAKYVPGNIAHHIGRVLLARQRGLDAGRVSLSLVLETAWSAGIGAVIAGVALVFARGGPLSVGHDVPLWQVGLLAAAAFAGPALGLHALLRWAPAALTRRLGIVGLALPPLRTFAVYCVFLVCSYLCLGLGVDILAREMFGAESHFLLVTGIMTAAWLLGFLVPGAPAGLGVRELVLLGLLGRVYDETTAVQLTVWLRLLSASADAIGFAGGLSLLRAVPATSPETSRPATSLSGNSSEP
jgi:hypothetical protein